MIVTETPIHKVAVVQSFNGEITIPVEKLVYYNNNLIRVYGGGYKFKMDEEPFVIKHNVDPKAYNINHDRDAFMEYMK